MPVFDVKQVSSEFAKAANSGDADALAALYTEDAYFVTGPGSPPAIGRAAVKEVLAGFMASKPRMDFSHVYIHENGDTALARGQWKLTSTAEDGSTTVIEGSSIEVLRRQPDGSWLYFIDDPWGASAL